MTSHTRSSVIAAWLCVALITTTLAGSVAGRGMPVADDPGLAPGDITSAAEPDLSLAVLSRTVGYGRGTVGGRYGSIRAVTNLNDSGPGSLRAALEGRGRRIVEFRVGGTIRLSSPIKINNPYVTVRGQTADPPGITVRGDAVVVQTHQVILRHVRLRPGDRTQEPSETDALTLNGSRNHVYSVVVDHVSMLWGPDIGGIAILGNVSGVTIQNSIMGEGLYLSAHPEGTRAHGGHSMAANVAQVNRGDPAPSRITFWHNLFTTSDERMPRLQGARCVDVVNNVIYNWGDKAAVGNPRSLNLVGNWFRRGPRTDRLSIWHSQTSSVAPVLFADSVYQRGNVTDGFRFSRGGAPKVFVSSARCGGLSVRKQPASDAYATVLRSAGNMLPRRDSVDARVIQNVRDRIGKYFNGAGYPAPNPYWP